MPIKGNSESSGQYISEKDNKYAKAGNRQGYNGKVRDVCQTIQVEVYSSLLDIKDIDGLSNKTKKSLEEFRDMINRFMSYGETMDIQDFIEKLVYEVVY